MPFQSDLPPALLLGPVIAAVAVYLVLRWVIWAPRTGSSPETVSQHALWVGVIGWMVSSLQGAMNIGIIPANAAEGTPLLTPNAIVPALAWPVLGCLGVHAVGQLSYPRPRRPRRRAILAVRRIRDFLPRHLAWTAAAIFGGAAGFIAWTGTLPAYEPVPFGTVSDGVGTYRIVGGDGRVPGIELAAWLGTALLVLAVGTCLVLGLISRRRQLESLTAHDNSVLRTIAMNRLLRTVSTVASGLAVIAGNFVARPDPASGSMSWTNAAAIAGMGVLLAMLFWPPPRLAGAPSRAEHASPAARSHPAARLVSSIGAALGGTAALVALVAVFLAEAIMAAGPSGAAGFVALVAVLVLLVLAAGELLLGRNYASTDAPRTWPRQPVGPILLTTGILALLVFLATLVVTALGRSLLDQDGGWIPPAVLSAGAVAAALPAFFAARLRPGIPDALAGLDAALRAITVCRMVRILAAMFMAQAAVLLLANSPAWAAVFGASLAIPAIPWWPATLAGALLAGAAVIIAAVPVRTLAGANVVRVPAPEKERAT
jgi:hypothetical protein